jgi:hypothetical protein
MKEQIEYGSTFIITLFQIDDVLTDLFRLDIILQCHFFRLVTEGV